MPKHLHLVLGLVGSLFLSLAPMQAQKLPSQKVTIPLWSLVLNAENKAGLPCRFRTTWDKIPDDVETTGLRDLNMVGSGQFSVGQLRTVMGHLEHYGVAPHEIFVVDLREEPHAFINGHAITWYAKGAWWIHGNPVSLVLREEKERLDSLTLGQTVNLKRIDIKDQSGNVKRLSDHSYKIDSLQTEEQIVKDAGAHYVRLPVTDHMRPDDRAVDQFLNIVKELPPRSTIYFHCRGGRGRTSTLMVMYDMIRNPKLPLDKIVDRQVHLGSLDVRQLSGPLKSHKHPNEQSRRQFLDLFYVYLNAPDGYGTLSWTHWNIKLSEHNDANNTFRNSRVASSAYRQS